MITTILWDVDGTLLDFHAAERAAIESLFHEFGFGICTDEMLLRYSSINSALWRQLEENTIPKERVLIGRFEQFFAEYGLEVQKARSFNEKYQLRLGDTIAYCDDSYEIVQSLRGKWRQYVVSNGTITAQTKKLERSGLGSLMDGIFLSESLGVEKPNPRFFDQVFDAIGIDERNHVIIVGDTLSSDIQGGMNAGIRTCWYNPKKQPVPPEYRIDLEISNLHELIPYLEMDKSRSYGS